MVLEYFVVRKLMFSINDGLKDFANSGISDLYEYFKVNYNMNLEDYVSDFIGCDRGCTFVREVLNDFSEN